MRNRRNLLKLIGIGATVAVGGYGGVTAATDDDSHDHSHGGGGAADSHVAYVRNVEEVRGHLNSSLALKERDRQDGAALHAGHGADYFVPVLTPVRDADPELASRLRAHLRAVQDRVESDDADAFGAFLDKEVFPLLDDAVETVVPDDVRDTTAFHAQVLNALAGRLTEEYTAAVTPAGEIELSGEYWDGRGFLGRMEERHDRVADDVGDTAESALSGLRSEYEDVAPPSTIRASTIRYRVGTAAAADLESAHVDGTEAAVAYVRNAEEARGHAYASEQLLRYEDSSGVALHAGHGADYAMTLLPPVQAEDPDLAATLQDALLGLSDRANSGTPAEYASFIEDELHPTLDDAIDLVLDDDMTDSTSFQARVSIALLGRIEDEYTAAVTDDEVIELYGEYWDARGFYNRVTQLYDGFRSDLDSETRELVDPELDRLGEELRTAVPPWDVANSIYPLTEDLERAVEE
jgi:hypothetical protein